MIGCYHLEDFFSNEKRKASGFAVEKRGKDQEEEREGKYNQNALYGEEMFSTEPNRKEKKSFGLKILCPYKSDGERFFSELMF